MEIKVELATIIAIVAKISVLEIFLYSNIFIKGL
jgi:hypothetical protein